MAVWVCSACGSEKEARCKPRKCPECGGTSFGKKEADQPAAAKTTPAASKRPASRRST